MFLLSFSPLLLFALIAILNAFTFPRLRSKNISQSPMTNHPSRITVLIPMRNESAIIADTVRSLLAQDYPDLEILLLDDHSTDNSTEIARAAADGDPRLRILPGAPLPPGWTGKVWACHQLAEQAQGDYLLFTDADVRWRPGALSALMAEAQRTNADLLTVWPTQMTQTWGERLVVPLMAFTILAYLPVLAVHHLPWPVFSAAMGQCLLFRRESYRQIGGHAAIKNHILDDMAFAYAIKRSRLRLRAADANGLIQTRMYQNWPQVRDGFAKNILAGHANSVLFLLFSMVFHWWLFVLPWFLLLSQVALSVFSIPHPFQNLSSLPFLAVLLGVITRALTAATSRQRIHDSLLMPVSVFLMTLITFRALQWRFTGGPQWKGRQIHTG
jgi:chlorobactene glucosyltransferase